MRFSDPTHLYEGELSGRADRASRAVSVITHAPFLSAFMFVLVLALNILGDALRDALDPRLKS